MLSLAERFTNKLEQPRFTWLPHYLAKAINLCGQACKAGLSVQIAHNQEVCVQLCILGKCGTVPAAQGVFTFKLR